MGRKIILAVLLTALVALPAFAAVQNVKVGGELRFRAYNRHILRSISSGSVTAATSTSADPIQEDWMEQRTRVNLSADLTENVSTYIRLTNTHQFGNGGGTGVAESLDQAYLKLGDMLNTMGIATMPLDMYLGRQALSYGKKLLIGVDNGSMPMDTIRLVTKYDTLKAEAFFAKLTESYAGTSAKNADIDFMGLEASYTGIEKITLQPYLLARVNNTRSTSLEEVRRTFGMLIMADNLIQDLNLWVEPAVQRGIDTDLKIKAFAIDTGAKYTFSDVTYKPWLSFEYLYATGDKNAADRTDGDFDQLYNDVTYGEVFSPQLNNIQIISVQGGLQLTDDLKATMKYYNFRQPRENDTYALDGSIPTALDNTTKAALGNEYDLYLDYQYTEDVATQLYWAYFDPGAAFPSANNDGQYMVRAHVNVVF